MKNLVLGLLIVVTSFATYAQDKKNKNAKYNIEVNGN